MLAFSGPEMPLVSLPTLDRANRAVISELDRHGFWNERLSRIEVFLVSFSWVCYGWQHYGGSGDICIPAVSLARVGRLVSRRPRVGLRDVLRHEWGHALADTHRGLFRSRRFSGVFGGSHERETPCLEWDPDNHVSRYAATNPSEDFAEVFSLWLKHGGALPSRFRDAGGVTRRWQFVTDLAGATRRGAGRW